MHDEGSHVPTAIHPASYDLAQRTVMLCGIVGSFVCAVLGYPCAAPGSWVSLTFRGLCFGYCICTLLPYLWGPGTLSRYLLRMCFVCTSFGAFLCSYSWCGRNIELLVVILWTLVFEAFCLLVLVQTHVNTSCFLHRSGQRCRQLDEHWEHWDVARAQEYQMVVIRYGHPGDSMGGWDFSTDPSHPALEQRFPTKTLGLFSFHDCFDRLK